MAKCVKCRCKEQNSRREEITKMVNRLSRIEGQIASIKRAISEGDFCMDILIQSSAVSAAFSSFNRELLAENVRTCMTNNLKEGNFAVVDDLLSVLKTLMK